jgi:hypothetical protein
METPTEYHYVYYSYEEWSMGYFGSRTCKCLPEEDLKYFGSFSDKTFKPTQKIILKTYATREEAYVDEIILQEYYKVVENQHFANRAYQTTTKFYYVPSGSPWNKGRTLSEEHRKKLSEIGKNKKLSESHKIKLANSNKGKKRSEETRKKMSESAKNRVYDKDEWSKKIKSSYKPRIPWNKGKSNYYSPEQIEKLRESVKIYCKLGGRGNKKK